MDVRPGHDLRMWTVTQIVDEFAGKSADVDRTGGADVPVSNHRVPGGPNAASWPPAVRDSTGLR